MSFLRLTTAARAAAVVAVSALALGCNDATEPELLLTGTWTLSTYGGQALPRLIGTTQVVPPQGGAAVRCDIRLDAMSLVFAGDDITWREQRTGICDDGSRPATTLETDGVLRHGGDTMVLDFENATTADGRDVRMLAQLDGTSIVVGRREYSNDGTLVSTDETELVLTTGAQ